MGYNSSKIFVEKLKNSNTDFLIYFSIFFLKKNQHKNSDSF